MSNDEKLEITPELLKTLKGSYLGWKQGEALERDTRPVTREEAFGLGYFDVKANLALSTIVLLEEIINDLSGTTGHEMRDFADNVAVASGSRAAKRLVTSLETIGQIGQVIEIPKGWRPGAVRVDAND